MDIFEDVISPYKLKIKFFNIIIYEYLALIQYSSKQQIKLGSVRVKGWKGFNTLFPKKKI